MVGEYDGRKSERATFLHEALLKAGVKAELSDDIRRAIWEKYVFLVALSTVDTQQAARSQGHQHTGHA